MASGLEPIPISSQKHDPAWKHCQMFKNGDRVQLKCLYCFKLFRGGGIHRIKEHLACQKGNASTCSRVPLDVRLAMQQSLDGVVVKKKKKQKIAEEITNNNPTFGEVYAFTDQGDVTPGLPLLDDSNTPEACSNLVVSRDVISNTTGDKRKRWRGKNSSVNAYTGAMISASLDATRGNNPIFMAVGRFLYDIGAPLDAVNSEYFQPMVDAIASGGPEAAMPSYHDIRGWILKNSVEEVKNDVDRYTTTWGKTGCSILVDQWNTEAGRTLLCFLAYCPEGTVFLKSVDASGIMNSSDALYELLKQVVEEVGVRHVLQVITSSEEQFIAAGRRLTDTFPTLYWTPCAARCLDLILEDFAKLEWINAIIEQARAVTRFVYNHSVVLNMLRRYTFGNDIVEPGITRSATNFTTLRRMISLKPNLQAMVTSQEWMDCPYSKKPGGLEMLDIVSNQSFWSSCGLIVCLTNPLLRLLRIVGSERRPSIGYVYAGMYRAKDALKKELIKRDEYMVYWNIIDHWWEQLWHLPLHAAGFFLNPKFFYSIKGDIHNEIVSRMFDCIERLVPDTKVQDKISKEINLYKDAVGDFGRKMAIRARDTLLPAEWWSTYGGSCPNLARLATRIQSQTCSSLADTRNQIHFERIYDTRNCLERQRLIDLVFVQYNLRLKHMVSKKKQQDSMDPMSFDSFSTLEEWITGKDICLEDYGSSDWKAVEPPSGSPMLLGSSDDEVEELAGGSRWAVLCGIIAQLSIMNILTVLGSPGALLSAILASFLSPETAESPQQLSDNALLDADDNTNATKNLKTQQSSLNIH
ncbi:BED-type domain-containing protein [Citrus sinensis]|nr:BED-type domain-containing protein [Citrus sinensis]